MSEYCDKFKKQVIDSILNLYVTYVQKHCTCVEEHDHDLTKNPWEIEIKFDNANAKWIKIHIETEDAE